MWRLLFEEIEIHQKKKKVHAKNEVKEWMGLDPELAKLLGVPATWIRGEKKKGDKYKIVRLRLRAGLLEKQKSEATNITFQALWIKRQQQPGTPPPPTHTIRIVCYKEWLHKEQEGEGAGGRGEECERKGRLGGRGWGDETFGNLREMFIECWCWDVHYFLTQMLSLQLLVDCHLQSRNSYPLHSFCPL